MGVAGCASILGSTNLKARQPPHLRIPTERALRRAHAGPDFRAWHRAPFEPRTPSVDPIRVIGAVPLGSSTERERPELRRQKALVWRVPRSEERRVGKAARAQE